MAVERKGRRAETSAHEGPILGGDTTFLPDERRQPREHGHDAVALSLRRVPLVDEPPAAASAWAAMPS
jgi:hypothetical protein